jgi:hypothetical protein
MKTPGNFIYIKEELPILNTKDKIKNLIKPYLDSMLSGKSYECKIYLKVNKRKSLIIKEMQIRELK